MATFRTANTVVLIIGIAMILFTFAMFTSPKVQTLVLRLALIFPAMSVLFFLTLVVPRYWSVFEAAQSIVEAYLIYCYFRAMLFGIGGWKDAVECIKDPPRNILRGFQKSYPHSYLVCCEIMLFQFFIVRPALYIALAAFELGVKHSSRIVKAFEIFAMIDLVVAMIFLFTFYEAIKAKVAAFNPTKRIIAIKGLVLLVAIENQIATQLSAGRDSEEYELKFRRFFAFAVMVEVFILSIFSYYFFGLNEPLDSDAHTEMSHSDLLCSVLSVHSGLYPDSEDKPLVGAQVKQLENGVNGEE